jgi:DNA replication protein DnaC
MTDSTAERQGTDGDTELRRIDAIRDLVPEARAGDVDDQQRGLALSGPLCPTCRGAGWLGHAVPYGHPLFGVLTPCTCKEAERAHRRKEQLSELGNLTAFAEKTFATLNPFVTGLREVLPAVLAYAQQPDGWLSLFGPYGVGKTHLAAAIANEVLGRDEPVLFVVVPDLLDHLRATFGPDSTVSFDARFEQVRTTHVLILDDLGTESATSWAREKLYQLLNHRYNLRLPTVITTNLKPDQLDPRIYSRMCDPACGQIITISAGDYRRRESRH